MCGHGVIALTTILLESGLVDMKAPETRLRLDTPAGLIRAYGEVVNDQVERVFFENVPSWVVSTGNRVTVPGLGEIRYDLAFGGALFAFVEASSLALPTTAQEIARLAEAGRRLLETLTASLPVHDGTGALFGIVFTDRPLRRRTGQVDGRQVCVLADGCVDRSPGGMALSARLALLSVHQGLDDGVTFTVEGITGSTFQGRIVSRSTTRPSGSMVCEIEGQAWITGQNTFLIAADDPFRGGFLL